MKKIISYAVIMLAALCSTAQAQSVTQMGTTLWITASDLGDVVYVSRSGARLRIEHRYLDPALGRFQTDEYEYRRGDLRHIVFFGGDGNDYFECEDDPAIQVYFDLMGGNGKDVLIGGPNDDYIDGGGDGEYDYLIGGGGADTFVRWWYWVSIRRGLMPSPSFRMFEWDTIWDYNPAEGDSTAEVPIFP